jgi:catechol-2,3-dioxygenase
MKRMHLHIGVKAIEESVLFYSALFGVAPVKLKPDYAKWMLDDPRINFAISTRTNKTGVDHLGIQVDAPEELNTLRAQMSAANIAAHSEGTTTCCYAESEKSWTEDPNGLAWEIYHTMEDAQIFSSHSDVPNDSCCTPDTKGTPGCCTPTEKTTGCCG